MTFPCGAATGFISIVKSVCKTQLGNQLSSFATLVYFQVGFNLSKLHFSYFHISKVSYTSNHNCHLNSILKVKYGMRAFLDPAQTKALGQVFDKAALGIGGHNFHLLTTINNFSL